MKWLRWDEALRLVEAMRPSASKDAAMFCLLTGARVSEALLMRRRNVDLEKLVVTIPTLKRQHKKFRKGIPHYYEACKREPPPTRRLFPITDERLRALLERVCEGKGLNERLFPTLRSVVWKAMQRAAARIGIDRSYAHPHVLRHSFAMHLTLKGVPTAIVKNLLGHARLSSTQVYVEQVALEDMAAWLRRAFGEEKP